MQDFPDTLDCFIPQETDAITPEEREELKVSGQYWSSSLQEERWICTTFISMDFVLSLWTCGVILFLKVCVNTKKVSLITVRHNIW